MVASTGTHIFKETSPDVYINSIGCHDNIYTLFWCSPQQFS